MQAFTAWLFAFVTPYMYNVGSGSGNLGAKTGFVFMGSSILLFVMAFLWIPETQGLTTEDIDYLYEKKISPRRFRRNEIALQSGDSEDAVKVEPETWSGKSDGK
jgi:hypothetical protein